MKLWLIRLLGGMVCAIAALALAMGVAHAEEKDPDLGVEAKINVKLPETKSPTKVKARVDVTIKKRATTAKSDVEVRMVAKAKATVKLARKAARAKAPAVKADLDLQVGRLPVDACVRVNAGDCTGDDAGSGNVPGTGGTSGRPTVGADVVTSVGAVAEGVVCLRVNGGDCGTSAGSDPATPTTPATPTIPTIPTTPIADVPGGDGSGSSGPVGYGGGWMTGGELVTVGGRSTVAGLLPWARGTYGDDRLARTGARSVLLPLLVTGLVALLLSGLLLRRRRSN